MDSPRGASLWTIDTDDCCFQAEVVDLHGYGWEFRLFINDRFRFSQRFPQWSEAVAESERRRRDLEGAQMGRSHSRDANVPVAVLASSALSLAQLEAVSAGASTAQAATLAAEPNNAEPED